MGGSRPSPFLGCSSVGRKPDKAWVSNGRLTQIGECIRGDRRGARIAVFQCECGNRIVTLKTVVKSGASSSCGCATLESVTTHGMSMEHEYQVWLGMKSRCQNKKDIRWRRYGGRGITVCERWRNSYQCFFDDMGKRPPGTTIERSNNNGNYCPENCQWATPKQQANNRSTNRVITIDGESKTLAAWAEHSSVSLLSIVNRLKSGFSARDAVFAAPYAKSDSHSTKPSIVEIDGVSRTLSEWSDISGVNVKTIKSRMNLGWNVREAVFLKADRRFGRKRNS